MPVLVLPVAEYLDKLLKYGRLASAASLGELGGVVVVAVDLALVLVVAVLGSKDRRAQRAREVLDVVFSFERRDVRPSERTSAFVT